MKFSLFLLFSLALHFAIFFAAKEWGLKNLKSSNFSKRAGQSSIKARLVARRMKRKPVPRAEVGELNKPANNNKSPMDKVEDMSKTDQQRGSDTELAKYLNEIREMILKNKHKAAIAKRLGLTGLVRVSFKIEAPNKLKELKVIKSSGKRPLDDSAVETVRRIGELPEIPLNLKLSEITINLEMEFE